jgi:transposase-like protein
MPGSRYDASTKAQAIRLVREHAEDYQTEWTAITAVSGRLGVSGETLHKRIRQAVRRHPSKTRATIAARYVLLAVHSVGRIACGARSVQDSTT